MLVNNTAAENIAFADLTGQRRKEPSKVDQLSEADVKPIEKVVRKMAFKHLRRFGIDPDENDVADVANQCWETLVGRNDHHIPSGDSLIKHLAHMAIGHAGAFARQKRRFGVRHPLEFCEVATTADEPLELLIQSETCSRITLILESLAPNERHLVVAFYIDEVSLKEVASQLDLSPRVAKRMLTNITCRIRRQFQNAHIA